jgi:hypothetical protein
VRDAAEASDHRHVGSRVLHALDRWATKPTLALSVVAAVVVWVLYSAVFGFPARLETIFQTLAAATTLAMVFVLQHTQARSSGLVGRIRSSVHAAHLDGRRPTGSRDLRAPARSGTTVSQAHSIPAGIPDPHIQASGAH